jgi:lipase ATG15
MNPKLILLMVCILGASSLEFRLSQIYERAQFRNSNRGYLAKTFIREKALFNINDVFDPQDKPTILNMANICYNTYEDRNSSVDWKIIEGYNPTDSFGWYDDGMRGYVYTSNDNGTIIIAIKGTSLKFLGYEGPTSEKDQLMDNLMFSCCCARVSSRWDEVCDCYLKENQCSQGCLQRTMQNDSLSYFKYAEEIYLQLKREYPRSTIWSTAHSLGGSIASLLAIKYDIIAVTFEAPGELLYAQRLGLDYNADRRIYHYGNNADPIFTGTCNGVLSSCSISGYAMESKCHAGYVCVYELPVIPNVNNHRITYVIDNVITPLDVPQCRPEVNCTDCNQWQFV